MRSAAVFVYGLAAGMVIAWALTGLSPKVEGVAAWFALASSLALAVAILFHWRSVVLSRGRRWHKTRPQA